MYVPGRSCDCIVVKVTAAVTPNQVTGTGKCSGPRAVIAPHPKDAIPKLFNRFRHNGNIFPGGNSRSLYNQRSHKSERLGATVRDPIRVALMSTVMGAVMRRTISASLVEIRPAGIGLHGLLRVSSSTELCRR